MSCSGSCRSAEWVAQGRGNGEKTVPVMWEFGDLGETQCGIVFQDDTVERTCAKRDVCDPTRVLQMGTRRLCGDLKYIRRSESATTFR
jgi:hypothetical protein